MSSAAYAAKSGAAREPWRRKLNFLWLEVTRKCNLKCVHCYTESAPGLPLNEAMSYERWRDAMQQAYALGCRDVQFIGGEPTLYPELPQLIRDARRIGFKYVEVYTNGTVLSRKLRQALVREKVNLGISVHGSREEVHDKVTEGPGSFTRTIENIRWAVDAGLPVRASIIETPLNAADVKATRSLLRKMGVSIVEIDRARGVGRGKDFVDPKSLNPMNELCGDCWRGKLAVDPNGNVFPCVFSRFCKVGHISESLASVLQNEQLHNFRKEVWNMSNRCKPSKPVKAAKAKRKAAKKGKKSKGKK